HVEEATMELIITAARLIDGTGGAVIERPAIVIREARIAEVRPGAAGAPVDGARVVDLGERTLLPGLIDTHLHFAGNYGRDGTPMGGRPPAEAALYSAAEARAMLDAGFTTVRDCGSKTTLALKRAIEAGAVPGPR